MKTFLFDKYIEKKYNINITIERNFFYKKIEHIISNDYIELYNWININMKIFKQIFMNEINIEKECNFNCIVYKILKTDERVIKINNRYYIKKNHDPDIFITFAHTIFKKYLIKKFLNPEIFKFFKRLEMNNI